MAPKPSPAKTSNFYTLVPIRPRSRGERRFLRTFAVVSLRPALAFNTRPRRLSTRAAIDPEPTSPAPD
jgi:hypothetical protein